MERRILILPISSAQIVSTPLTQMDSTQIVPLQMAQLPSLLMHTGWTNHQIILQRCCTLFSVRGSVLKAKGRMANGEWVTGYGLREGSAKGTSFLISPK